MSMDINAHKIYIDTNYILMTAKLQMDGTKRNKKPN